MGEDFQKEMTNTARTLLVLTTFFV